MKVLHIVKTVVGARWALEQVRVLTRLGVDVVVALPSAEEGLAPEYRQAGAEVVGVNLDFPARQPWRLPSVLGACREVVRQVQPDIIHSHHVGTTIVVRLALGRNSKIPRIFQVAGPLHLESPFFANLDLRLAGPCDRWIATCEWTRRKYLAMGVPPGRVFLSYAGTNIHRFGSERSGALRAELGLAPEVPLVGMVAYMYAPKWFVGQQHGLKGHEDFFAALNLARRERPEMHGVVIGGAWDGANWYEERLRYQGRAICGDSLTFLGTRPDVAALYPDLDLAVVPSHSENCGGALEPLLCGVPVVATNLGGLPDIVRDGETGWLVSPSNPGALARGMLDALSDQAEARRRAREGQELVRELFDIERTAREVAAVYERVGVASPMPARRKRIKVLHTLGSLDPGGVETWLLNVLKYIDRDEFEFEFCTFGPQAGLRAAEAEALGAKVLRCPRDVGLWRFSRRFRQILREGNYDVVHSHVHLFSGAILRWAKAEDVPIRIAHSHTSRDDQPDSIARHSYRRMMKRWIRRYATQGLAASRPAAAALFGMNWEKDHRFRILHCAIDLTKFEEPVDAAEVRREFGIPPNAAVVGHVGRFVPAKNHEFLLEIAAEIAKARPDVHFLLVGDGPLRGEIESQAKQMGFNGNIHFAGARTDVPRLMRGAMNAFVLPSVWEGLPVALLEAQAAALPCFAAAEVAEEAAIERGTITFLEARVNSKDWARAIVQSCERRAIDGDRQLSAMKQSSFSVVNSAQGLMNVYKRANGRNAPSGTSNV